MGRLGRCGHIGMTEGCYMTLYWHCMISCLSMYNVCEVELDSNDTVSLGHGCTNVVMNEDL